MIKTIIFDLGEVVIIQPKNLFDIILLNLSKKFDIDYKIFKKQLADDLSNIHTGKMDLCKFYKRILNALENHVVKPEELLKLHLELYNKYSGKEDEKIIELINRLKEKYYVACLSNTEPEISAIHKKSGLYARFNKAYASCDLGLEKPNSECYEKVLGDLNIEANQAVFIDNLAEYVEGARKVGIHGILYRDINQLKTDLNLLGIKI